MRQPACCFTSNTKTEKDATVDNETSQWQSIRTSHHRAEVAELALVLASVGIDHNVHRLHDTWHLIVPANRTAIAEHQLQQYRRENLIRPRPPTPVHVVDSGRAGVLGYLLVIWSIPFLEFLAGADWRSSGIMHAAAVLEGEWWRTLTALTLHADLGHIFANSLFGTLFGWLAGRYLGSGAAWLLVVVSAGVANGLNAGLQSPEFRSIGASTAVFASLGLVGVYVWRRGYLRAWGWRRSFAPVFAAIALVAYTGTGGANTDVAAHLLGFAVGAVAGGVAAALPLQQLGQRGQQLAGATAFVLIIVAWWAAQPLP